jgi:N-methylhydantoinase A
VQTIADALGIDLYEAARGVIDIVNENMFGALRMISVQQGYDPRDFALMGFGGAGPLHVNAVAKLMGSWPAVSPVSPGVLCALGDATTRMRTETARSYSKRISAATEAEVLSFFNEMDAQIRATLKADGVADAEIETSFEIDIRYHGQAFEVPMVVTLDMLDAGGLARLAAAFDEEHRRLFTFNMDAEHEFVNLRAVAVGKIQEIPTLEIEKGDGDPSRAKIRDHEVWADGGMKPAVIYDRGKLRAGDRIPGPAIITEMDSTTLVLPDCEAVVDVYGVILINPAKES